MRKQQKKMSALDLEVQALLEQMRVALAFKDLSESTMDAYTKAVRLLSVHFGRSAVELDNADLESYLLYLVNERKLAASTINQKLFGMRFLYRDMLKRDYSVFEAFKNRKRRNQIPICLTHEEVKQVLAAVRSEEYRAALTLCYCCGLRVSEVCAVQIDHVMTGQGMLLVRGKGEKKRSMPLPVRALELLRENYRESRPPRPWMFGNGNNSGPMNKRTVQKVLKSAVRSSGVNPAATVHTLRHSYATTLLRKGVDITTVQRWLGHKSVQTTMDYLHVIEQAAADNVKIVNETMGDL